MNEKFYLTTAIDYSNGEPHLGTAYEKIGADCIARYRRIKGQDVHFLIGMDEHGQKVQQSAQAAGCDPQEWVDTVAGKFEAAWRKLDISNTNFIRTTEERHRRTVTALLKRIQDAGHVYEGRYAGFYCVGCESFKQEKDLSDGKCPEHPSRKIKWVEEPNYFFRLSQFNDRLLALYERNPGFLRPPAKMNEIRNVVQSGLQDLSVSRSQLPWGIPWPGDESHSVYVWFDALINYLSATGFPDPGYERLWPADLHIIGPDIARFHAAIWPAMLMAADVPLPECVWAHGWMNYTGTRFSKSEGVQVDLDEAVDRFGPDALRYFLLREVPWDSDGNFSWERFDTRYTSELADGYGNLASRVLAMIVKYRDGIIPDRSEAMSLDNFGLEKVGTYADHMDEHLLHLGAQATWELVSRANGFIEEQAPWTLAREGSDERLEAVLASLARCLGRISLMASPFLPNKTRALWEALAPSRPFSDARLIDLEQLQLGGTKVAKPEPLFPKPA